MALSSLTIQEQNSIILSGSSSVNAWLKEYLKGFILSFLRYLRTELCEVIHTRAISRWFVPSFSFTKFTTFSFIVSSDGLPDCALVDKFPVSSNFCFQNSCSNWWRTIEPLWQALTLLRWTQCSKKLAL